MSFYTVYVLIVIPPETWRREDLNRQIDIIEISKYPEKIHRAMSSFQAAYSGWTFEIREFTTMKDED